MSKAISTNELLENWTSRSVESVFLFTSPDGRTNIVGRGKNAHEARADAAHGIRIYEDRKRTLDPYQPKSESGFPLGAWIVFVLVMGGILFLLWSLIEQVWRQL